MIQTQASTPSMTYITPSTDEQLDPFNSMVPLSLTYGDLEYTTCLSGEYVVALDHYRSAFSASSYLTTPDAPKSLESLVLLFAQFLLDRRADRTVIKPLMECFEKDFLALTDIHSVVAALPESKEKRKSLLATYFTACERCGHVPQPCQSALLKEAERGNVNLLAVFGGQGPSNPRCYRELHDLYRTYTPLLHTLIETISTTLSELCRQPDTRDFYRGREIDLLSWINSRSALPDDAFLAAAPVSLPLLGAIALAHWSVLCQVLHKSPGEARSLLSGVTGHSQGIIAAVAISKSDSWSSFYENARLITRLLFWLGYESHQEAPRVSLSSAAIQECKADGNGLPTSMLHVGGLGKDRLVSLLNRCNKPLPVAQQVYIALSNSRWSYTLAGPASSLVRFNKMAREISSPDSSDESRVPFDQRKPVVETQFLPVSAPFHTPYLAAAAERVKGRLVDEFVDPTDLTAPVYHTLDGSDITSTTPDIVSSLVDAITTRSVDWPLVLKKAKGTHILVFGKGLAEMVARNVDGKGVKVISAAELSSSNEAFGTQGDIFTPHLSESFLSPPNWGTEYRPQLVRSANGDVRIQTKLTKLLGAPPVTVAAMTPTTVPWDFVAAILNAGYHAELAGGGYYRAEEMSAAIAQLAEHVPPHRGITCNLIYVSPQAMAWQIALLRQMARAGRPIDGLSIGAGVPSLEVATEYITTLGLKHITFKPGSEESIERVLEIARAHPSFPVIIQWTGGRGGGHHSYEDFHAPILHMYSRIRLCSNVILIAGSGFGDAAGSYPYLTGCWSLSYGYPSMPFDGILLGSRVMTAKEAHTSLSVKQLICDAPGATDAQWTQSYRNPVGGIVTVQSEMGQPIHKVATRGVLFWKEMDEQVFSLPKSQQLDAINKRREHIIRRLNDDFAKPWFGRKFHGEVVDLDEMTYLEIVQRLIELMYLPEKGVWIHASYKVLVRDFVTRTLERFHAGSGIALDQPDHLGTELSAICPQASSVQIHPEDRSWFIKRCRARGQKPVNFVPVLDADLSYWMKKDSLWQSENIEAVVDQDPGRVCILQGPVAVQHCRQVDEPVADILDGITRSLTQMIQDEYYSDGDVQLRDVTGDAYSSGRHNINIGEYNGNQMFQALPGRPLPSNDEWLELVASRTGGWMRAIFTTDIILQGRKKQPNLFQQILRLDRENVLEVDEVHSSIVLNRLTNGKVQPLAELNSSDGVNILARLYYYKPGVDTPTWLNLQYQYDQDNTVYPLSESLQDRNFHVKSFYHRLWLGPEVRNHFGLHSTFGGYRTVLSQETLDEWIASVGMAYENDRVIAPSTEAFPLNATIIPAWEALVEPLMLPNIDGDLLRLVHLSIEFQLVAGAAPLHVGEAVKVTSQIESIVVGDSGKTVTVVATLSRGDHSPAVKIISRFLIQGSFSDASGTFERKEEPERLLSITGSIDEAVLRARKWLVLDDEKVNLQGETLRFRLRSFTSWKARGIFSTVRTTGTVFIQDFQGKLKRIGQVAFEAAHCHQNPVTDFLTRKGKLAVERHDLEDPGWATASSKMITMPTTNEVYSKVSKDVNPIHTSPIFATLANLPGTIAHGMYTSAVTSTVLDQATHDFNHLRTRRYSISFVDMVLPGEAIRVQYRHVAMKQGRMIVQIQAVKPTSGDKVLDGEIELEQVPTGYVFTGQGSQAPGMGMELYKSSPVAKKIWDDIDRYLLDNYGWSILQIVRENPKQLTIHFAGKRGRAIRNRYMAMAVQTVSANGDITTTPLLPNLTPSTRSFTFEEPKGLLYATQFAQPAITVLEKATFEDMRANGLIQEGALFAGHSLGEYGALACLGEFIGFQDLLDIAFYRGLTMQMAVDRDEQGATDYSMVAANPGRVSPVFNEAALCRITETIATETKELLEIVNFNVEGEQYVCAGHNANLHALGTILNQISKLPRQEIEQWVQDVSSSSNNSINSTIRNAIHDAHALSKPITLTRGRATIPLAGIDVPFHSSHLRPGVAAWRNFLLTRILPENVQPDALEGKFVPNVMGRPFSLNREYIAEAARLTGTPMAL
ncbi:acyl transferase domain-containing protein [Aspergillus avenaceus]|uniref:Acyl transferase domain-containing protein n=1 Tax=Aspergillus avenaceus TaxID=36643 RepID=A0A5N6U5Y1_ASPAV|nr:acyl transferase domain-containing protein [Aspergillus avenaceus]